MKRVNMVLYAFLLSFIVAPVVSLIVYLDSGRRDLTQRKRLLWVFTVGLLSFCGFLLPHLYESVLNRAYVYSVKAAPIVTSPIEILALHVTIGLAISTASILLYWSGIRWNVADQAMEFDTS